MNSYVLFNLQEGGLLIRILIAFILCQSFFRENNLTERLRWKSTIVLKQVSIYFLLLVALTQFVFLSLFLSLAFYLIKNIDSKFLKSKINSNRIWILLKLMLHLLVILISWSICIKGQERILTVLKNLILDYKVSLVMMGFVLIAWPASFIVTWGLEGIISTKETNGKEGNEKGGGKIGFFERVIILTLVLLNQYEAIGFLITGKSIIRFRNSRNEHIRSEYILVGTMLSYSFAIITGVLINWLLKLI